MTQTSAEQWRHRLRARTEAAVCRRAAAAAAGVDRKQRRVHGLAERQAARLARNRIDRHPFAPDPECSE